MPRVTWSGYGTVGERRERRRERVVREPQGAEPNPRSRFSVARRLRRLKIRGQDGADLWPRCVYSAEDDEVKAVQTQSACSATRKEDRGRVRTGCCGGRGAAPQARGGDDAYRDRRVRRRTRRPRRAAAGDRGGPATRRWCCSSKSCRRRAGHRGAAPRRADSWSKGETTAPQLRRAVMHAIERAALQRAARECRPPPQAERIRGAWAACGGIAHDFNNLLTGILQRHVRRWSSSSKRTLRPARRSTGAPDRGACRAPGPPLLAYGGGRRSSRRRST